MGCQESGTWFLFEEWASQPQAPSMSVVGPKTPALQKLQPMDFPAHTFPHIIRRIMDLGVRQSSKVILLSEELGKQHHPPSGLSWKWWAPIYLWNKICWKLISFYPITRVSCNILVKRVNVLIRDTWVPVTGLSFVSDPLWAPDFLIYKTEMIFLKITGGDNTKQQL